RRRSRDGEQPVDARPPRQRRSPAAADARRLRRRADPRGRPLALPAPLRQPARAGELMAAATTVAPELRGASDEQIEAALAHARPMVLRGLLHQLTGDPEVAATRVAVDPAGFQTFMMVADEADVAMLRRKAVELLQRLRDSAAGPVDIGPDERLRISVPLTL